MKIGFVVNPIAGMGGAVALKGTDGPEIVREAVARGARQVAPARAIAALLELKKRKLDLEFVTASGEMGSDELKAAGLQSTPVITPPSRTTREDTMRAVGAFVDAGAELILFAGGDGTARDVAAVAGSSTPILGIPAGVKMHSSVFAVTPEKVADAIDAFAGTGRVRDAEVMDVDEGAFRDGILKATLFGTAKVPDDSSSIQSTKDSYHTADADDQAEELAEYIAETMEEDVLYVLGPGSTTAAVARRLAIEKTVLGVDVVKGGKIVLRDACEADLVRLAERYPAKVVVSPIGSQGFFFGRGNQQISPRVIRKVGIANVIVIATPVKLLGTPELRVDTGDPELDSDLKGHIRVVVGYGRRKLVKVV